MMDPDQSSALLSERGQPRQATPSDDESVVLYAQAGRHQARTGDGSADGNRVARCEGTNHGNAGHVSAAASDVLASAHEEQPCEAASGPILQFSMRHLFWTIAVVAVCMAVMARLGVESAIAFLWLAVLVAGHVVATAWGTSAKRRATRLASKHEHVHSPPVPGVVPYAPPTRLRDSTRLSRIVPIVCAIGALLGSLVGTVLLVRANWGRLTFSSMLVGAASCAVIGGFVAFLASSFITVASAAARQAREQTPPARR
ncbi:MAG: hypothetical protein K6T86_06915 [Pirellulales bacterium]|nr:hypothetical protein [Pirellulales bacterium]